MLGIIIQARTGSSRLPNKMVLPFLDNKGILELLIGRLTNAGIDKRNIVLATTINKTDDILEEIAHKYNINVFRGSEDNVLQRFISAADEFNFDKIIRICADNPFLDIYALLKQINLFESIDVDYLCYALSNNTPTIKTHFGFYTEAVTLNALRKIERMTNDSIFLEHVTNFVYINPQEFSIQFEYIDKEIEKQNHIRLTIDTIKDFELGKCIYRELVNKNIEFKDSNIVHFIMQNNIYIETMKIEIEKNQK